MAARGLEYPRRIINGQLYCRPIVIKQRSSSLVITHRILKMMALIRPHEILIIDLLISSIHSPYPLLTSVSINMSRHMKLHLKLAKVQGRRRWEVPPPPLVHHSYLALCCLSPGSLNHTYTDLGGEPKGELVNHTMHF